MPDRHLPIVVVDTTAFGADLRLAGAAWGQTLALAKRGALQLQIPSVVIRETARHYQRETADADRDIRKLSGTLNRLGIDVDTKYQAAVQQKLAQSTKDYEERLRAELEAARAKILLLPKVSHSDLLDRDLSGRKPFDVSGKGYRDSLIWASIVELCSDLTDADTLIFVTNNSGDFCDKDKPATIAQELARELPEGLSVLRYADLKAMLADQDWPTVVGPTPALETRQALLELLAAEVTAACDRLTGSEVEDPYSPDEYGRGLDFDFSDWLLPTGMETITVESIEPDFDSLEWEIYDALDDGTQLAKVNVDATVILDGFMHHADYYAREDAVEVHDADWNEHYAWVYVERRMHVTFNTRLDEDLKAVEDIEFDSASAHLPR